MNRSLLTEQPSSSGLLPSSVFGNNKLLAYLLIFGIPFLFYFLQRSSSASLKQANVPFVGARSRFEPRWLIARRFGKDARSQINEGYEKFKTSPFVVARIDTDIMIIPHAYIKELQSLSDEKFSAVEAHIQNFAAKHASANITAEEHVNLQLVQTNLTPKLGSLISDVVEEATFAFEKEIPQDTTEWKTVSFFPIVFNIVLRTSARIFVGSPTCRNDAWLAALMGYSQGCFSTSWVLKHLPTWIHSIIIHLMPSYRLVLSNLDAAAEVLTPVIRERRKMQRKDVHEGGKKYQKPEDMLQWMMDLKGCEDENIKRLAHYQTYLALAATQTPAMTITHILYDLCLYPKYLDLLRTDISESLQKHGGWTKAALDSMRKLDSFMKESQRLSPPSLLSFSRVAMVPITLRDGTHIPKGTYVSVAAEAILLDEETMDFPTTFDGLRYFKKRVVNPSEERLHQFGMTDSKNLHFGHGKYACPGRFFASCELKIIIARLIFMYEFRFPDGCSRPMNMTAHDLHYPDMSKQILMRKRNGESIPEFF